MRSSRNSGIACTVCSHVFNISARTFELASPLSTQRFISVFCTSTTSSTESIWNDRSKRPTSSEFRDTPLFLAATSSFFRRGSRILTRSPTSAVCGRFGILTSVSCMQISQTILDFNNDTRITISHPIPLESFEMEASEGQRQTLTIEEAAKLLGIGRNNAYMAARNGEIPII